MNLSTWAIAKPAPSILLFVMLTVAGALAYTRLGVQSLPDMAFPTVSVTASQPGASPVQLEAAVARPIEDSVAGVGNVRHITTTISDGSVSMLVEFSFEKDLQEALIDVRDAVTRVRSSLPGDLQEPVVSRVNLVGMPLQTYVVSIPGMDELDTSWFVDDVVQRRLLKVKGVARIDRLGGADREIGVYLDPLRLQALGITAGDVSRQLRSVQQEAPGGRADLGGLRQAVRTVGTVAGAEDLAALSLPLADGRQIRLADVAQVRDSQAEREQLALLDGKRVVSFQVMRARGYDDVRTAQRTREAITQLQAAHPGAEFRELWNTSDASQRDLDAAMRMLIEGAVLAILVVWLFLRDWRATVVSAVALPLSIIPTFLLMAVLDYSLNMLSVLALTLVIGVLVDDAIVEVENIMRHLAMGKAPLQAAREAADEIGLAVVATSLTLVAVFLPTALVSGLTGELFRQFGLTAACAVLFSLLVARLLTPMMSAHFLQAGMQHENEGALLRRYLRLAAWCLAHPWITLAAAGAIFGGSLVLINRLPSGFITLEDTSTEIVVLEAPPGSTLETTEALTELARSRLAAIPEIEAVFTAIGVGLQSGNALSDIGTAEVRIAQLTARLDPVEGRSRSIQQIRADMRERLADLPGARIGVGKGTPGEKMSLVLSGDDPVALLRSARAVEAGLRSVPRLGAVQSSASVLRPEILIHPDFVRAARLGVTSADIGEAVRIATIGDYEFNLSKLDLPGRQLDVRVLLDPRYRRDPETVGQLRVHGSDGAGVPLSNLARIEVLDGPAQIDRYDRQRYVEVSVELRGVPIGEALKAAKALPALKELPAGVHLVPSGDLEYMDEMFGGFVLAMLAGIFCVYAVMVLLFHDFGQPVTVLAALPLASAGALGLLWVFDYPLSMASLIGLLMLVGIVTKNSILLVDYAIVARRDLQLGRTEALLDACRKRARPIVMTTVAMAAGMLPSALGIDGDGGFRVPMAIVVIGGLVTSTVLSLVVVPVVFEVVDDLRIRMSR